MNKQEIRRYVSQFRKEYSVRTVTYDFLCDVAETLGYTVVEFSHISNDAPTQTLIDVLSLQKNTANSRGFTFANESYRLVFVHRDLSDKEKVIVLAHELGHIYFGHLGTASVIGRDVKEEFEANEFAHYLLNPGVGATAAAVMSRHKKVCIAAAAAMAAAAIGTTSFFALHSSQRPYGDYYLTQTGSKYHTKDCIYVEGKDNVRKMTEEEFNSGRYEPCKQCLPELWK